MHEMMVVVERNRLKTVCTFYQFIYAGKRLSWSVFYYDIQLTVFQKHSDSVRGYI